MVRTKKYTYKLAQEMSALKLIKDDSVEVVVDKFKIITCQAHLQGTWQ